MDRITRRQMIALLFRHEWASLGGDASSRSTADANLALGEVVDSSLTSAPVPVQHATSRF